MDLALSTLGSGLFGSLLGGLFRLAPELLKFFDRHNERKHELAMFKVQADLEKQRGDQKLAEIGAQHQADLDVGVISAFKSAVDQQTEMVKAAGKGIISAISATVRPVVTYWLLLLYSMFKVALFYTIDGNAADKVVNMWTTDDMALMCGVINYWFMDRTLAKRGLA